MENFSITTVPGAHVKLTPTSSITDGELSGDFGPSPSTTSENKLHRNNSSPSSNISSSGHDSNSNSEDNNQKTESQEQQQHCRQSIRINVSNSSREPSHENEYFDNQLILGDDHSSVIFKNRSLEVEPGDESHTGSDNASSEDDEDCEHEDEDEDDDASCVQFSNSSVVELSSSNYQFRVSVYKINKSSKISTF